MASNGQFLTNTANGVRFTFAWSLKSQDVGTNKSIINWSLSVSTSSSSPVTANNLLLTINGTTAYTKATTNLYSGMTVASGTASIVHNTDGTKSFDVLFRAGVISSGINCSGNGTFTLNTINRSVAVGQSLADKIETAITIAWSANAECDYLWYSLDEGVNWTGIDIADGKSGEYTIAGLTANTTYQIKTRVRRKDSQLLGDSTSLSVKTYPYPYANSMPNFVIGNKVTIGLYNPLGRMVTVNMIGADNSQISSDTTELVSVSGYNSTVVVNRLYASIPNSVTGTYKIKVTYGTHVETRTGGTYGINTRTCKPTIGTVSYIDTNQTTIAITGDSSKIIQNKSIVRYSASGLVGNYGATLASCSVTVNGNTYSLTLSGSSATGGLATIDSGTNVNAVFTLKDSRGVTATKQVVVQMIAWSKPTAIITLHRHDNFYSETDITVDTDFSQIGTNQITINYKAKKKGTSSWTVTGTLSDNVTKTFTADNNYEWNVQVIITDTLGGSTTYNLVLSRGTPIIFFDRLRSSVGINCFPKEDNSLEVNGHNVSRSVMTRSLSAEISSLTTDSYTAIELNTSKSAGTKLTATNDGGIQIGENVSKVLVSGCITFSAVGSSGTRHARIVKNTVTAGNSVAWTAKYLVQGQFDVLTIPPILADVQEGDVLYLDYYTSDSGDKIQGNTYGCRTSMTVDVIY